MLGLEVVINHYAENEHYMDSIEPLNGVPWFCRILAFFGISPFVCWISEPVYRDKPPVMFGNKILVSRQQYDDLLCKTIIAPPSFRF